VRLSKNPPGGKNLHMQLDVREARSRRRTNVPVPRVNCRHGPTSGEMIQIQLEPEMEARLTAEAQAIEPVTRPVYC
jgi:hypothetical protein